MNQEMAGAGTPVAIHVSAPEPPSEMDSVGFWESIMAAWGATGRENVKAQVKQNNYDGWDTRSQLCSN